jgi:hypothetical protein
MARDAHVRWDSTLGIGKSRAAGPLSRRNDGSHIECRGGAMSLALRTTTAFVIGLFLLTITDAYAGPIRDAVQREATRDRITSKQVQSAPLPVPEQFRPRRGGSIKVAMMSAAAGCGFGAFVGPVAAEQNSNLARANGCAVGGAIFGVLGFFLSMR